MENAAPGATFTVQAARVIVESKSALYSIRFQVPEGYVLLGPTDYGEYHSCTGTVYTGPALQTREEVVAWAHGKLKERFAARHYAFYKKI